MKKSYYYLFLLAITGLFQISCKEDVDPVLICGSSNPTEEVAWIKTTIEGIENSDFGRQFSYIRSGTIEGNTYLYVGSCCPSCYWVPEFYTCDGVKVENQNFSIGDLENLQLIYLPESSTCQFE
jgi:hypothetical protein